MKTTSNGRRPETEAFGVKPECDKVSNEDNLQPKRTSKYEKWNISETTGRILLKFENKSIGIKSEYIKA